MGGALLSGDGGGFSLGICACSIYSTSNGFIIYFGAAFLTYLFSSLEVLLALSISLTQSDANLAFSTLKTQDLFLPL